MQSQLPIHTIHTILALHDTLSVAHLICPRSCPHTPFTLQLHLTLLLTSSTPAPPPPPPGPAAACSPSPAPALWDYSLAPAGPLDLSWSTFSAPPQTAMAHAHTHAHAPTQPPASPLPAAGLHECHEFLDPPDFPGPSFQPAAPPARSMQAPPPRLFSAGTVGGRTGGTVRRRLMEDLGPGPEVLGNLLLWTPMMSHTATAGSPAGR